MMPPERWRVKANAHWYLFILSILLVITVNLSEFFDANIRWFELATYILVFLSSTYAIWKFGSYKYYCRHPLIIKYQEKIKYETLNTFDFQTIKIGTSRINLRIVPRRTQTFQEIHLRLVNEKKWDKALYPTRNSIAITSMQSHGLPKSIKMSLLKDNTNGLHGFYEPNYERASRQALILTLIIKANKAWSGYLVFRTKHVFNQLQCTHLPLKVEEL